jgi:hypothetical protein
MTQHGQKIDMVKSSIICENSTYTTKMADQ